MNLQNNMGILAAFMLYLAAMMGIGIYYSRRQKKLSQFILGDRKLGPWVTSMSAEASDMSGWMLMGLPGFAYLNGLSAFWTGFGLIVGTWANWVLTSKRLRHYTEVANNSLTIPDYLSNRFEDHKSGLRLICALFIILFFIIYTSSGFVSAGKLFNTILGLPYFCILYLFRWILRCQHDRFHSGNDDVLHRHIYPCCRNDRIRRASTDSGCSRGRRERLFLFFP